ncbi:hypothetical protein CRUP_004336 [Coryphaenoides rupestris]|nr:hypothetical protein CRUP_004336 [Coryphaenoides rupestris]
MYERQKVYGKRAKQAPAASRCSGNSESCLAHLGCCDPCASCHCRFFNAICFCRKTNTKAVCRKVA